MSKQWWKGKQEGGAVAANNFPVTGKPPLTDGESVPTTIAPGDRVSAFASTLTSQLSPDGDDNVTQIGPSDPAGAASPQISRPANPGRNAKTMRFDTGISDFSASNLFSVELADGLTDPDMEEAAIRFANGDVVGAEEGLLSALQTAPTKPELASGWAVALFDLYRATGQQASFDNFAMDYAGRFGQSPPAWFSTPELLGHKSTASQFGQLDASAPAKPLVWQCPAELDLQAVQALQASQTTAGWSRHIDWSRLQSITPEAGAALAGLFSQWCEQAVQLHFGGIDVLEKTLRTYTMSGDKHSASFWWQLRLDVFRILHLQDEFELAALDFCVLYEVSPPPWQDARCKCVIEASSADTAGEGIRVFLHDSVPARLEDLGLAPTVPMGLDSIPAYTVELTGEVLGDVSDMLEKLKADAGSVRRLVIACGRLIRVDFSAAGSILNWVCACEAEGCQVEFHDVPRLVLAFFNVIGIDEHARVMLRKN